MPTADGEATVGLEDFAPHVGETFVADLGAEGTVALTLDDAAAQPTGNDHDVAFSIVFRGPLDRAFEQCTVSLMHEGIGSLDVFLVPIEEHEGGRLYEAVFTRLIDPV